MCNPSPYEALAEKELQDIVVSDDRNWRSALEELLHRGPALKRKSQYWIVDQDQLASHCLIVARRQLADLQKGRRFESWLADILDEAAIQLRFLSWRNDEGEKTFHALKKRGLTPHDWEDVQQETFCKVMVRWKSFDSAKGSLSTWFRTIAWRTAIDLLRKKSRSPGPIPDEIGGPREPQGTEAQASDKDWIEHCFKQLPRKEQEVLTFRICEGMTPEEIAEALGIHQSTVYRRLESAIQNLRKWAEREEG